jgi:hypothetical protein
MKVVFVVLSLGLVACGPETPRPCENPAGANARGTTIRSPALECSTRLCLVAARDTVDGGTPVAFCTAVCNSDSECNPGLTLPFCQSGFVCAPVAIADGNTSRKVCACAEDVVAP